MSKKEAILVEGFVRESLPNAMFRVEVRSVESLKIPEGHMVLASVSGRIRLHHIRILLHDRVDLELTPYDLTRGRITYRHR